jgi:hypothetical protein
MEFTTCIYNYKFFAVELTIKTRKKYAEKRQK